MTEAFIIFVGYIIEGFIAVFGEELAILIIDTGLKLAALALLGLAAEKLSGTPDLNDTAKGNLLTVRGTVEHQRIVYGEILLSGPLWYLNVAGTHNQSMYHAVVLAGHEIEDITDVWLDDDEIPNAAIDWGGNGSVDSGWLAGDTSLQTTTYFDKFLGTSNQASSPDLTFDKGGAFVEVTSQHQGRGIAWFLTRMDYFDGQTEVWSGGAPRNYKALVKGKKIYNPNSDTTQAWGTGPHRLASSGTWEYSNDPALCWADYMIDSHLGFGEDSARINYAAVASAMSINSEHVATPNSASTQRFTCNGALSTAHTHEQNIEAILSAGNMTMTFVQGKWKIRGWELETPTLTYGDDELRGDIQIQLSKEETKRFNEVRGIFIDRERLYQPMAFPTVQSSEYLARDNSDPMPRDIQLALTTDLFMAQRLAFGILEQSDLQRNIVYPSNFKTLPVEIGGTIKFNNTKMGWVDEIFRVNNYKLNDMKGVDLVLQEDNAAAYTDVGTAEYIVSTPTPLTTNAPGVPEPGSFFIVNIAEGTHLHWTPAPARISEFTEIWRNTVDSFDNSVLQYLSKSDNYIDNPPQGHYFYHLRSQNIFGEVSTPTGSIQGLFLREESLVGDTSFEKSPLGQWAFNDPIKNQFWSAVGTSTLTNAGISNTSVVSADIGVGGTQHLHYHGVTNPNTGGPLNNLRNQKISSIVRGLDVHIWMKYRVPVFDSGVNSLFMDLDIQGINSARNTTEGLLRESRINITNSLGWTVFSDSVGQDTFTNVQSRSLLKIDIQFNQIANANSGTAEIDIDEVFLQYVKG